MKRSANRLCILNGCLRMKDKSSVSKYIKSAAKMLEGKDVVIVSRQDYECLILGINPDRPV